MTVLKDTSAPLICSC